MRPIQHLLIPALCASLFFTISCSEETMLAEQCETETSCESNPESKTDWVSTGGIGAGVLALGALAGSAGGGGDSGGSSTSSSTSGTTSTPSTNTTPVLTGTLLDSAVAGVTYSASSGLTGTTNASGEFEYRSGDQITFTVGGVLLGTIEATAVVTPLELAGATTTADARVVNLSRFLQTLDSDQAPENGIFISSTFRNALSGRTVNFDANPVSFETTANTLLSSAGVGRSLVDGTEALEHLHGTLGDEGRTSQIGSDFDVASLLENNSSCFFDGVELAHNTSVQAYSTSSVAFGETCQSETRTCNGGSLSGTYAFSSCSVGAASSCTFNGDSIAHGDSVGAYEKLVTYEQSCKSETRVCENGVLSGSFLYESCSIESSLILFEDFQDGTYSPEWEFISKGGWECDLEEYLVVSNGRLEAYENGCQIRSNVVVDSPVEVSFDLHKSSQDTHSSVDFAVEIYGSRGYQMDIRFDVAGNFEENLYQEGNICFRDEGDHVCFTDTESTGNLRVRFYSSSVVVEYLDISGRITTYESENISGLPSGNIVILMAGKSNSPRSIDNILIKYIDE